MKKLCINNKFIKTVVITIIAIICFGAAFSAADKIAVSAYAAPQIDAFFAGSAITSDGNTTIVASNHYYIEWNDLELVYDGNGKTPTAALKCVEDPDFSVTGSIALLNSEDGGDNAGEGEQTQEPTEGGEQTDGTVDSGSSGSPTEGTAENVESNEQTEGTTDSADGNSQTDSVTSEMIDAGTYMVQVEFEGLTLAPEIDASKEFTILPCTVEVKWSAGDGAAEDPTGIFNYTYNGQAQGPEAYYMSVNNESVQIVDVSGLEENAKNSAYTAYVDANAAGGNYTLTNTTCPYTISPFSVAVQWKAYATEEGFIIDGSVPEYEYNGYLQGPVAYYTSVSNVLIPIAVNGHEINANTSDLTYTASIDRSSIDSNYTLNADAVEEYTYKITPKATAVIWIAAESYTYDGEAQGPTATYETVNGEVLNLLVTGLGINAGSHIASVAEDAAGGNYTLTGLECGYEIAKYVASVVWQGGSCTYNGEAQGPGASFKNVYGDIIYLTVSGLGTDAGRYTAQVAEYAAGRNYILTNLEYDYEIAKAVVNVTWSVADYYINNDEVQGPHAYIVNESGEMIELSILNLGTESGEYVAEIDLSSVNPNFELSGELQKSYEIIPETAFGNGGIALSVVLGAILLVIVILAIYFYIRRKNTVLTMPTGDSYSEVYEDKDIAPDVRTDKLKERNKQLKAYIRQLEHEISNIRKSNQKYDSENIKLQEEMENLNITHHKELGKLNDKYNMLTKELESVKAQHASKIMRMEEERANLNTAHNKEIDKLNTICASQKQQLEGAKQENDSQRRQFTDKINSLTGKYDAEIDRLSKDNLSLRKQQEKDKKEFETIKQDFERISREARARAEEDSQKIAMLDKDIALKKEALSNKEDALHEASEELRELKERIAKNPNFYKHPIEEYFDDIDKAYETAQACDFDINNPLYCYSSQREALDKIMGLIAIYRSQKR